MILFKSKLIKGILYTFGFFVLMAVDCFKKQFNATEIIKYDFEQQISLQPYSKIYHINDTIWLTSNTFSKNLFDRQSSSLVGADTFLLTGSIDVTDMYSAIHYENAADFCEIKIHDSLHPVLNNYGNGFSGSFSYGCNSASPGFNFTVGVVAKAKGYFGIRLFGGRNSVSSCRANSAFNPCERDSCFYSQVNYSYDLPDVNKDIFDEANLHIQGNYYQTHIDYVNKKEWFSFKVE